MKNIQNSSGNAFVIVLILIALLAALTITLTRMGSTTQDVSQEQANVLASQILRQGRDMSNAVSSLINKGCSYTQLSFENSSVSGYTNAQSPADKSCWLFDAAGAGMAFAKVSSEANDGSDWRYLSGVSVSGVGPEREAGTLCAANCQDIVMSLAMVNLNVCKAINVQSGVTTSFSTAPPADINNFPTDQTFNAPSSTATATNFSTFSTGTGVALTSSGTPVTNAALWNKKSGCFEAAAGYTDPLGASQSGTGKYFFYHVLFER